MSYPSPPPPPWAPPYAWRAYYTEVQKRGIRRLSNIHGGALLFSSVLQAAVIIPLSLLPGLIPALEGDPGWNSVLQMALTVLTLGTAALLCLRLLNPHEHNRALPFGRPFPAAPRGRRGSLTAAVICLGLLACFIGGLLSNLVETICNSLGFSLAIPDDSETLSGSPWIVALRLLVVALSPAVIEELLMRGAIMQPLRRYGDVFAVVVSSLLFALLHGNVLQSTFALFAGLGMGFAVVLSGSIWPGIVVHFVNNAISVLLTEMFLRYEGNERMETLTGLGYYGFYLLAGAVGVALLIFLLARRSFPKLWKPDPPLAGYGTLAAQYLFHSVPMVLALLGFVATTILMAVS